MNRETNPPSPEKLDFESFVGYIHPFSQDSHESQLPPSIDLGAIKPYVDELYDHQVQERIHEPEYIESLRKNPQSKDFFSPDRIDEMEKMTGAVERSRIIYIDPFDQVGASPMATGTHNSVRSGYDQLPSLTSAIMLAHTHPDDGFFSPLDNAHLLRGVGGHRTLKSSLVLCPNIQILAVATTHTPILERNDRLAFINYWTERMQKQADEINAEAFSMGAEYKQFKEEQFSILRTYISQLDDLYDAGSISDEQYDTFASECEAHVVKIITDKSDELIAVLADTDSRLKNILNQLHIESARSIGIKLYTSTDRETFYAAGA